MYLRVGDYSIRNWQPSDAGALAKYADNRNIWLRLRDAFPHPYGLDEAQAFLAKAAAQDPTTYFAIASDKEAIGGIGIMRGEDVHRLTAELGYWLAEPYWGRGIMTRCVETFCTYAFSAFQLQRIHAEPYADNHASAKVLEKAGFCLEGRMRSNVIKDGRILDQLLYALVVAA